MGFPIKNYNTFGLDYRAENIEIATTEAEALAIARELQSGSKKFLVVGGGSNLLFVSDFDGTILLPEIEGIAVEEDKGKSVIVSAGAGVVWDDFVEWCVGNGLSGVENLSLIPGKVGATPVQNIGAYGAEAADTIVKVRGILTATGEIREFSNSECCFGYRESVFKKELRNRFIVTKVFFRLSREHRFRLDYGFLEAETAAIGDINLRNIRQAVINIRSRKLPDPKVTGNAGSFFKNPVVTAEKAGSLKFNNPLMPVYDEPSGGKKIAAGWLIEQCGWKGKSHGNAGVHDKQALVIVNRGGATGREIYELSEMIRQSVMDKFGIALEREVEVIGSI